MERDGSRNPTFSVTFTPPTHRRGRVVFHHRHYPLRVTSGKRWSTFPLPGPCSLTTGVKTNGLRYHPLSTPHPTGDYTDIESTRPRHPEVRQSWTPYVLNSKTSDIFILLEWVRDPPRRLAIGGPLSCSPRQSSESDLRFLPSAE